MKKLFKSISLITLTLILTLGLFGCGKKPVSNLHLNINQNQNVNVATSTNATSTSENLIEEMNIENIDVSDWKTCADSEIRLSFKYPSTWGNCSVEINNDKFINYSIKTDYSPFNVFLKINTIKINNVDFSEFKNGGFDYVVVNNKTIFKVACGGALRCMGIVFDDQDEYQVSFSIFSNQPTPEGIDGLWMPNHNVTDKIILNIMGSFDKK